MCSAQNNIVKGCCMGLLFELIIFVNKQRYKQGEIKAPIYEDDADPE